MEKTRISLKGKIILYTIIILLLSVTMTSFFITRWAINNIKEKVGINNMNTAINVANAPFLGDILREGDPDQIIQKYTDRVLESLTDISMVVVADMEGLRYAHPNKARLGEYFVGGDEKRIIETGEAYISEATGTLGHSLRAFAPIYDSNKEQVGFVMVGTLMDGIISDQHMAIKNIVIYAIGGLALGIIGSVILAYDIKESLLGLEPYQITRLYNEKNSMLKAIQEGIIAIDDKLKITTINDSAIRILDIDDENVLGKNINQVFPTNNLEKVLATGVGDYEQERELNGINVVTNTIPVVYEEKVIGVVTTFRDKTEVTRLAEEITGVNQIVDALRANTHEFMNKLHIILGLIQIGDLDQAKRQIVDVTHYQQRITSLVMNKIKDPMVSALIIGKHSRGRELGIDLVLEEDSSLEKNHGKIHSNVLVTILGNFIENALESIVEDDKDEKKVRVKVYEDREHIEIQVMDTGKGIPEEILDKIFKRDYSTKSSGRGVGLFLVKTKVENLGGDIKVLSKLGQGTKMIVYIPKEGER